MRKFKCAIIGSLVIAIGISAAATESVAQATPRPIAVSAVARHSDKASCDRLYETESEICRRATNATAARQCWEYAAQNYSLCLAGKLDGA
jgi:hypothetical protein